LVTLSACVSGLGQSEIGEHLISLRRSLYLAGARATVTSLWPVGDHATRDLMGRFYERILRHGEDPGMALRTAQLQVLREARRVHAGAGLPGRWGAFVFEQSAR
jgi:CHAT domain-containing protein